MADPVLSATDVAKRFADGTAAVRGGSCGFYAGEIAALVGPSGSGKSTLLLCLAGVLRPDSGEVRFGDSPLTGLSDRELAAIRRTQFGFVFQLGMLVGELSALRNVELPLMLRGASSAQARSAAMSMLERLGVADLAAKRPAEVSIGQAQRVAVARALVGSPRVVFADEPTGSLDSHNGEEVFRALEEAASDGAAVVMVTHDEALARRCARVMSMVDGTVG